MSSNNNPLPSQRRGVYAKIYAQSATASTNVTYVLTNPGFATGLTVYWTIHSLPASLSTTANIGLFSVDPATGSLYAVNTPGVARSAVGLTKYMIGQHITTSGNSAINTLVGNQFQLLLSLSTGATSKDVVFSLGIEWTT